jgi:hypothetical protein
MNDIGWLFLFMSTFQDNSVLTKLRDRPESSRYSEIRAKPLAGLTVEQILAVGQFFELLAKWDEGERRHGN